jgi:cold shock CspA family protein
LIEIAGFVESFDDRRGDGQIQSDHGERFYFHCVAISDGSRSIRVGARVTGERRVGRLGRDEVGQITALS